MEQSAEYIRTCYDAVARQYEDRFADELRHKPLDRELLNRFATEVRGHGEVLDLGCGPGQTTAYLHGCEVRVCGLDVSSGQLQEAAKLHSGVKFEQGNMLVLPRADGTVAGVVAFYSIVHFSPAQLSRALAEIYRVLQPEGQLLLAFHVGEGSVHVEHFLGGPGSLEFFYFTPAAITDELAGTGFARMEVIERDPYPDVEYPSRRAYILASKPELGAVF